MNRGLHATPPAILSNMNRVFYSTIENLLKYRTIATFEYLCLIYPIATYNIPKYLGTYSK